MKNHVILSVTLMQMTFLSSFWNFFNGFEICINLGAFLADFEVKKLQEKASLKITKVN